MYAIRSYYGLKLLSSDGRTPQQQIDESYEMIRDLLDAQQDLERELLALLAGKKIHILQYSELNHTERQEPISECLMRMDWNL